MSAENTNNMALAISNAMADAVEQAGRVTVLVNARRRLPLSGIIYTAEYVLTANHGVEREEDIQVMLPDGREVPATLAGRDQGSDLALLRLEGESLQPAQPAGQEARVGHLVLAVGRPTPEGVQASMGMVTAVGQGLRTMRGGVLDRYIVADTVPYPGFSGGPLVDISGAVLGINTSGLARGTLLAIPWQIAGQVASSLQQHGHVKRGYLGIRSQPVEIPTQSAGQLGREQLTGLLVVGVEPEGPASNVLMVGDILVGLNGQPVSEHDGLMTALSGNVVGQPVSGEVLRGGKLQTVQLTVGERR